MDTDQKSGPSDELTPIWGPHLPSAVSAKRAGSKYFFTGDCCHKGHFAPRYTKDRSCTACKELNRKSNREKNRVESREWRKANPDKVKEQDKIKKERGTAKAYYIRTRDWQIAKAMAWNAENPDRHKEHVRKFHSENRQLLNDRRTEKRRSDPETANQKIRAYRSTRREHFSETSREWRMRNPELVRVIDRNKKIRRKGAEGKHTIADIERLLNAQRYKCAECQKSVEDDYHVDHIYPLSKGGTNWPSNLQILCPACNMEKHATDPFVFARRKGRLL